MRRIHLRRAETSHQRVSQACADEWQGKFCNAILGDMLDGLK